MRLHVKKQGIGSRTAAGKLALAAALTIFQTGVALATDWPQPGMNAQHNAFNANETILSAANVASLRRSWDKSTNAEITAQPVTAGKRVFVLSTDGTLYARSATSGKLLWTFVANKNGAPSTWGVAAGGNLVFVNCQLDYDDTIYHGHGGVCAINAKTGAKVWSYAIYFEGTTAVDSAPYSPAVLDGKNVIFGESDSASFAHVGYVMTLDAQTGNLVAAVGNCADTLLNACNYVSSAPAAADKGILFYQSGAQNGPAGTQGAVCARGENATIVNWCYFDVDVNIALTVAKRLVLFVEDTSTNSSNLVALNEANGAVVWSTAVNTGQNNTHFAPAVANNLAYFSVGQGMQNLYAVSLKTGKIVWSYTGGIAGNVTSGVSIANGVVYAVCQGDGGVQCAFDAATGAVLRSDAPGSPSIVAPLVANGAELSVCNFNDLCRFAP